jgi:hypothetical protein
METTSQQYNCAERGHIGKISKWEYNLEDGDVKQYVAEYGCTECDAVSPERWPDWGVVATNPDHIDSDSCTCFGCKAQTLQLATGDATGGRSMTQKKWDQELNAYSTARKQGIQPAGTSLKKVQEAVDASNKAGKAFNANTGGFDT